jgi:hypothetical protein
MRRSDGEMIVDKDIIISEEPVYKYSDEHFELKDKGDD